ncbi:hypothetical protein TNCV_1472511 [Trichonephila clavipes]|nr:hypothetical protein TNCV_1472511 [Trichonephila clavipes]
MRQFVDVAIQPEVRFIAKQNSLMKIGNDGHLVLGPFVESTPCLMIVLMNCPTKLRINHLTAVISVAILETERYELIAGAVFCRTSGDDLEIGCTEELRSIESIEALASQ